MTTKNAHKLIDGVDHKHCTSCDSFKPISVFFKNKTRWDGYQIRCRDCERVWKRNKEQLNVPYKIELALRCRIRKAVKRQSRNDKSIDLLGCSYAELVTYIEKLFVEGMSWDNYGPTGWHIDHIKPCASFDLTNQDEQRKCFHYTNLQPLWAVDNLSKGARW